MKNSSTKQLKYSSVKVAKLDDVSIYYDTLQKMSVHIHVSHCLYHFLCTAQKDIKNFLETSITIISSSSQNQPLLQKHFLIQPAGGCLSLATLKPPLCSDYANNWSMKAEIFCSKVGCMNDCVYFLNTNLKFGSAFKFLCRCHLNFSYKQVLTPFRVDITLRK